MHRAGSFGAKKKTFFKYLDALALLPRQTQVRIL